MSAAATLDALVAKVMAADPLAVAIEWEGRRFDWAWVSSMAERIEQTLLDAGHAAGAPVALITRQQPDSIAALLGFLRGGRSTVMVYSYQSTEAIAQDVQSLNTGAVVASADDWSKALIETVGALGAAGVSISPDGRVQHVAGLERVGRGTHRPAPTEPWLELLTSGTSGPPKRYPASFEAIRRRILGSTNARARTAQTYPMQLHVPVSNISGIFGLIMAVGSGRPVELHRKFTAESWVDYVRKYRPSQIALIPAGFKMILDLDVPPEHLESLQYVVHGMGPVDPAVRKTFEARYNLHVLPCYGATEFLGAATAMTAEDHKRYGEAKYGSVGRAVEHVELRIVDEQSEKVLPLGDRVGLLEVLNHDLGQDWIRTNDLAHLDEDGFLFLHGRADGVINRGGFKIHPGSVESALLGHPAVAMASVVGVAHPVLGEVPVAALEAKPGAERPAQEVLKAFLRERLTAPSIPVTLKWVDTLPRTPSHKVRLDAVRELFTGEPRGL